MRFTTGFALLLGLGARIAYNKLVALREPGIEDHVLSGLWQGVALYYFLMEIPSLAFGVCFGMAGRVLVNLVVTRNAMQCACTLLGGAVGVFLTDLLSQVLEDDDPEELQQQARFEGSSVGPYPRQRRLVQLRRTSGDRREHYHSRRRREFLESTPSVTTATTVTDTTQSLESLADWIDPSHKMTPLEREVAALRRKATMADSERRRFKEEKKWAQSQGNTARANQMGWQVKRYAALMQSFHREADIRLLEASNTKHREEMAHMHSALSQVAGPTSTAPRHWVPPAPPANVPESPASPPPRPVPAPVGRQTISKPSHTSRPGGSKPSAVTKPSAMASGSGQPRSGRRTSLGTADKQLPAGSAHTGTHHRRTTSILSRPSVRIEVHENLSSRARGKQKET